MDGGPTFSDRVDVTENIVSSVLDPVRLRCLERHPWAYR